MSAGIYSKQSHKKSHVKGRNNVIVHWPYDFLWLMPPIGGKATYVIKKSDGKWQKNVKFTQFWPNVTCFFQGILVDQHSHKRLLGATYMYTKDRKISLKHIILCLKKNQDAIFSVIALTLQKKINILQ